MAKVTLGAGFDSIAGNYGGVVVANSRTGFTLRKPPRYRRPTSPGQRAAAERMALAAQAWNELTYDQARAWDDYAKTQRRTNPTNGRTYSPTGFTAFCGLAVRVLHVDPAAEIPMSPPMFPMPDEGLQVVVGVGEEVELPLSLVPTPVGRGGRGEGDGGSGARDMARGFQSQPDRANLHPPAPSSFTNQNEEGVIRFTASRPNVPGITTEILLQRLPNERRKPTSQYKTVGFHTFTEESPSVDIPVEPGIYVPAYAFIEPATGRTTSGIVLGRLEVGGSGEWRVASDE